MAMADSTTSMSNGYQWKLALLLSLILLDLTTLATGDYEVGNYFNCTDLLECYRMLLSQYLTRHLLLVVVLHHHHPLFTGTFVIGRTVGTVDTFFSSIEELEGANQR